MSSGIIQEPGFDTKIQQFTPIRNAPVWRRAVRQYHCLEDVNGTSDFTRLQFKVHCQEKNLVCNDARLVFPVELICYDGDPADSNVVSEALSMAVNDGNAACNIAVAQNSPWNAFETVNCVVNTKVYTEKPRSYGRVLSNSYQSVSEMQFMNNHSLKPIANTDIHSNIDRHRTISVIGADGNQTGATVTVTNGLREPSRFVLENANSGFLERSRQFQDGLDDSGKVWSGEISSLLNCGPFSAEARGQGNDQLPYIEDLFLNLVFKQTKCSLDASLLPTRGPDYRKVIMQSMFEFLTPASASLYRSAVSPNLLFPKFYTLRWRAKPYIQIEWLKYNPAAMLPMYRLQGFQYKLTKSNEFSLAHSERMDGRALFSPRVSTQCLSVPNKLYIWAELSENSARDSFLFGGMFRTCELMNKSLMVRVNGESHIIDRPDNQSMLFKWWKRHSNSVAEYPTWSKCPVVILTPNEIGLSNWLENDAVLSTIEISCDVRLSKLQHLEYSAAVKENGLLQAGVHQSVHNNPPQADLSFNMFNGYSLILSDFWGGTRTGTGSFIDISTNVATAAVLDNETPPHIPSTNQQAFDALGNSYLSHVDSTEKFRVHRVDRTFVQANNSVWVKYDTSTGEFVSKLFFVPRSHLFEFKNYFADVGGPNESFGIMFCPWNTIQGYNEDSIPQIANDPNTGSPYILNSFVSLARTYEAGNTLEPLADFNYDITMPNGVATNHQWGAIPGPKGIPLDHEAQGFDLDNLEYAEARYAADGTQNTGVSAFTTTWGENSSRQYSITGPTSVRWICMDPAGSSSPYSKFYTEITESGFVGRTLSLDAFYHCNVHRGLKNTQIEDLVYFGDGVDPTLQIYTINHDSETTAMSHFKYELNVLAEYSNQQIVMDQNRRVALQIENNVPVSV